MGWFFLANPVFKNPGINNNMFFTSCLNLDHSLVKLLLFPPAVPRAIKNAAPVAWIIVYGHWIAVCFMNYYCDFFNCMVIELLFKSIKRFSCPLVFGLTW